MRLKLCSHAGCPEVVPFGTVRCAGHEARHAVQAKERDRQRGTASQRGYGAAWSAFSRRWRAEHPLCEECKRQGRIVPAECVDHRVRWQSGATEAERERLKYSPDNLESLCNSPPWECHRRKTARRDGAFGNPRR